MCTDRPLLGINLFLLLDEAGVKRPSFRNLLVFARIVKSTPAGPLPPTGMVATVELFTYIMFVELALPG